MFGVTVWDARDVDIRGLTAVSAVDENAKDTGDGKNAIAGNDNDASSPSEGNPQHATCHGHTIARV